MGRADMHPNYTVQLQNKESRTGGECKAHIRQHTNGKGTGKREILTRGHITCGRIHNACKRVHIRHALLRQGKLSYSRY